MTDSKPPWRPLRERIAGKSGERVLVKGTPDYLREPLQNWLIQAASYEQGVDLRKMLNLRLRRNDIFGMGGTTGTAIVAVLVTDEELFEAIDAALDLCQGYLDRGADVYANRWWSDMVLDLKFMLEGAGSVWRLNDLANGLTTRVDETVAQATETVMKDAPTGASRHLRKAWNAAYGYHPDPTTAYSEAVKAVEAVVIPVTVPTDKDATLGKALRHIGDTQAKWTLAIDDKTGQPASVDAVIALIGLLWSGQRDRHAGPAMKPATQEAAQTAVHAAVALVQWFTSGAVQKAP